MHFKSKYIRRFIVKKDGVTALEFSLIAAPFFFIVFGIFEVGLIFFTTVILENGTYEASRVIRTGQAQKEAWDKEQFRQHFCNEISGLIPCTIDLQIDVRNYTSFSGVSVDIGNTDTTGVINKDGSINSTKVEFQPAGDRAIVVIRSFYRWPLIVPLLTTPLINMPGNSRRLDATIVLRNEPYAEE